MGDAAANGHLLVDLAEVELSLSTPLALLDPNAPPILPDSLPSQLEQEMNGLSSNDDGKEPVLVPQAIISGPTFDASTLENTEIRERFHRNLAAVMAVLTGEPRSQVAQQYGMHPFALARLEQRVQQFGQLACVPRATYHRERKIRPEFQALLRKLYIGAVRPTVMAVYEDVQLRQLTTELSQQEGTVVLGPSYKQVWSFLHEISQERKVLEARSGLKHPPSERMSPQSFVLSIPYPAHVCQVDEHTLDLLVVTPDGTVITRRVHGAVLICVKTSAILGAVLSLDNLNEEDYMRLLKQALEPKDSLVARYECKHFWPCYGKPALIFHDRGKIFTSERATQVVVDRFKITAEQAPPFAPSAKGTVEALFTWMTRKFEHRLPGTTKATAKDRGAYDSMREAEKAGITFEVLEKLFIQAIVDGYMQEWDKLRRQTRIALWENGVQEKGVPLWMGAQDDLKLLLMKAVNRKNPATGRYAITQGTLSFLGRRYVSPGLLDRLRGREVTIYYDRRDITVIYLFENGELRGEAYCVEFIAGRRVSIWEANAQRKADTGLAKEADAKSLENRQGIQEQAQVGKRVLSLEVKRLERQRHLDQQRSEIHPEHVQNTLASLAREQVSSSPQQKKEPKVLSLALPNDELQETECQPLPVRKLGRNNDELFS